MKILIIPMAAMAETAGPFSRVEALTRAFLERGFEVALCAADDGNSRRIEGVHRYPLSTPVPMGLPGWLGRRLFPVAERLGVVGRKTIHSFEEVLHLTGAIAYPYLKTSIEEVRSAIREFQPDLVYSEFNLSAIMAAHAEERPVLASYSYPAQPAYAASPQFAGGVNRVLQELNQPPVKSALELFLRTDCRIIPSSPELEPIPGEHNLFVGPLKPAPAPSPSERRRVVLVYTGNGTVSKSRLRKVITQAFHSSDFDVYVAGIQSPAETANIHFAQRFNFSELLPHTAVYINHGGQNSMMDGFLYGVPQLVCPGRVFERQYNAESVVRNGAGLAPGLSDFRDDVIRDSVQRLNADCRFREHAESLGRSLAALGGAQTVADYIEGHYSSVVH